jgi:aminomethyltransferase
MKKTFLYDTHVSLGAKMAPFGGFEMPIQYEGIFAEHFATRKAATVFDTCHMGEFLIKGDSATKDLEKILSCDIASMTTGQCKYGFICNENGGVIDDQITYKMGENDYFMVVNASTQDNDFDWIKKNSSPETSLKNISSETGKIDIQGPLSAKIVNTLIGKPINDLKYYTWMHTTYNGKTVIISRTGYTGEIGFEIYLDQADTIKFWNQCLELGAKPAGLGCRDTLRLEMGYPLYGHELDENRNANEAGFSKAVSTTKTFIGSPSITKQYEGAKVLCGLALEGRRATRNGDAICDANGVAIGIVTSGSYSPSLEIAIAMGYVSKPLSTLGNTVHINTGKVILKAQIAALPFYKQATARKKLAEYL